MFFKKSQVGKKISALILAILMVVSVLDGTNLSAFAAQESANTDERIIFEDSEADALAEGDLTTVFDKYFDTNDVSEDTFEKVVNNDIDVTNDIEETSASEYPASVDNSKSKYFPKVRSQSGIGSCTSWADVYYGFTYARCRALDIAATDDNIMSPAFVYNQVKSSNGGSNATSIYRILMSVGTPRRNVADFESYYYEYMCKSWFPQKEIWEEAAQNRLTQYTYLDNPGAITSPDDEDLNQMKKYLSSGYLITYTTYFNWDYSYVPRGSVHAGEYIALASKTKNSLHRMTIVGYDDNVYYDLNGDGKIQNSERGAFKIVNSWGDDWKDGGFCWVSYDALNTTSQTGYVTSGNRVRIFMDMAVEYVEPTVNKTSDINLVMKLNTAARDEVNVYITAKDKNNVVYSGHFAPTNTANRLKYALDGSTTATDGTVIYDLNNIISDITIDDFYNYDWNVEVIENNADNGVVVKGLTVEYEGVEVANANVTNSFVVNSSKKFGLEKETLEFRINNFTVSDEEISLVDYLNVNVKAGGGSGKYEYRFGTIYNGVEYVVSDYSTYNTAYLDLYHVLLAYEIERAIGTHTIFVDVKDVKTNEVLRETKNIEVKPLEVELTAETEDGKYVVGKSIKLSGNTKYEAQYRGNRRNFSYTLNGVKENIPTYVYGSAFNVNFVPTEAGEYTFTYEVVDYLGQSAEKSVKVNVVANEVKLYYNNDNWTKANVHYSVDGSTWTALPGVEMSESDVNGYKWMATIDLGKNDGATVCFNNGNGIWDSKNGKNYYLTAGRYGIKNETINEIKMEATVTFGGKVGDFYAYVDVKNGTAPYTYEYTLYQDGKYIRSGSSTTGKIYMSVYTKGLYGIDITVTDADGNTCFVSETYDFEGFIIDVKATTAAPYVVGNEVKFTIDYINYYYYKFPNMTYTSVTKDGKSVDYTYSNGEYSFVPTEAGKYIIKHEMPTYMGEYYCGTLEINVVEEGGFATVYYSSSWNESYIHYTTNGVEWTPVPGIKMEKSDIAGYDFKYTVSLNGANGATMCFNNGNGSWDSNNGKNYYVTEGTYTIKNGKIEKYVTPGTNVVKVYYNNNNWGSANIHYAVDNGTWTTGNGVRMESSDDSKYTWMYTIDLGSESGATVCFNNGNGSWDSKNGNNYRVESGSYAVIYGNLYKLS